MMAKQEERGEWGSWRWGRGRSMEGEWGRGEGVFKQTETEDKNVGRRRG